MTSPIAVVILAILPALARQSEQDMMVERLKRVHDLDSLYEEISAEGDRALITMAIIPAVYLYSARVERFLGEHKDFAMEFGPFARRASYLARMYLYKGLIEGELGPHADEELAEAVVYFERWLEQMRQRGLITYDPNEELRYVRPGVDPSTEELRSVLRLRHNLSAEVPADPIAGGELSIHVTLPSKILGTLCMAPPGMYPDTVEKFFLRLMHYFGAVFQLSFRQPERMHFEDEDRDLVIDYLHVKFETTGEAIEKGDPSSKHWQTDAESLERTLKRTQAGEHRHHEL